MRRDGNAARPGSSEEHGCWNQVIDHLRPAPEDSRRYAPGFSRVTPLIPGWRRRHNGRTSGTNADRQTTSQPAADPDLNRPIGHHLERPRKHGLSKLRLHEPERRARHRHPASGTPALVVLCQARSDILRIFDSATDEPLTGACNGGSLV